MNRIIKYTFLCWIPLQSIFEDFFVIDKKRIYTWLVILGNSASHIYTWMVLRDSRPSYSGRQRVKKHLRSLYFNLPYINFMLNINHFYHMLINSLNIWLWVATALSLSMYHAPLYLNNAMYKDYYWNSPECWNKWNSSL